MDLVEFYLFIFLPQAALLPILLLGIVLAVRYSRYYPQTSFAAAVALAVIFAVTLAEPALPYVLTPPERAIPAALISVINMAACMLLFVAIFGWRSTAPARLPSSTEVVPDGRILLRGSLLGACCGGILLAALGFQAPFYLTFFRSIAGMVTFGIGWGILVGATVVGASSWPRKGAILGAAAGFVIVLFAAAAVEDPKERGMILVRIPLAVFGGAALGAILGRGWQAFARK